MVILLLCLTACSCSRDEEPAVSATESEESMAELWCAIGVDPARALEPEEAPFVLSAPVDTLSEDVRSAFLRAAPKTLKELTDSPDNALPHGQAQAFVEQIDRLLEAGPSEFPCSITDDDSAVDCLRIAGAGSLAVAEAMGSGDPGLVVDRLSFHLRLADFMFESQPPFFQYLIALSIKRRAGEELLILAATVPDTVILARVREIWARHVFRESDLAACLRKETRISCQIARDFKQWLRAERDAARLNSMLVIYDEPLGSCSPDELLTMDYDADASLLHYLRQGETSLRWLESGAPLVAHPEFPRRSRKPHPDLGDYRTMPNGLFHIFEDCDKLSSDISPLISHQTLDGFVRIGFAWLAAEGDGRKVESPADLVPEYLDEIPTDPADGQPIRHRPGERVLYSIGIDLKDQSGISNPAPNEFSPAAIEPAMVIPVFGADPSP